MAQKLVYPNDGRWHGPYWKSTRDLIETHKFEAVDEFLSCELSDLPTYNLSSETYD